MHHECAIFLMVAAKSTYGCCHTPGIALRSRLPTSGAYKRNCGLRSAIMSVSRSFVYLRCIVTLPFPRLMYMPCRCGVVTGCPERL